jgi:mannan endo-1,4-beta-mannosidase
MRRAAAALLLSLALAAGSATALSPSVQAKDTRPWLGWSTSTIAGISEPARHLHVRPGALSTYAPFDELFPQAWADAARRRSVPLVVAWEPWDWDRPRDLDQSDFSLAGIAGGQHDDYVRQWARAAASSGVTVLLRFAPEMNGNWRPWSVGDSAADFVAAWRHLHDVFAREGVANVRWVFNPNVDYPGATPIASLWPGIAYVDWLGVDGYNWLGVKPGRPYETVHGVFASTIDELRALAPRLPLMIAECGAGPGAKDRWLPDLVRTAPSLGVNLVIWFEHVKETDWRMATANLDDPLPALLHEHDWRDP